jgi:oxygen-independent coproporphyrinogen-3 oxidase
MGRAHSAGQVVQAVRLFSDAGLHNFNLDLIAGFPGQTLESTLDSVRQAVDAGVPHLSLYMFREYANNLVSVKQVRAGHSAQRSPEERYGSYLKAKALLEAAGYEEYLIGYFAKGTEYRFDSEDYYFSLRGDYFGFGAGAGSVLGRCVLKSGDASRYGNSHVRRFVEAPLEMTAGLASGMPDVLYTDGYFKAFATREGIRFDRWNDQFGFSFQAFRARRPAIREWFAEREAQGAVFVEDNDGIRLSEETRLDTMIWRR